MSAKQKLKRALSAIDYAKTSLESAKRATADSSRISTALNELEDAESYIKKAIREIPDE
jgi:hypothetical protein